MERFLALLLFILVLPLFTLLYLFIRLTSPGPFLFLQRRVGKNKKEFIIYKIRTMTSDAEVRKNTLKHLNQADGPVFKIKNDPRLTGIGKILSRTGIDELPQLLNIIRGEMSFVGPRPLPVAEARQVPKRYRMRFSVNPGITSPWVVSGAHRLTFQQWMESDVLYIKNRNFLYDLKICAATIFLLFKYVVQIMVKS